MYFIQINSKLILIRKTGHLLRAEPFPAEFEDLLVRGDASQVALELN